MSYEAITTSVVISHPQHIAKVKSQTLPLYQLIVLEPTPSLIQAHIHRVSMFDLALGLLADKVEWCI